MNAVEKFRNRNKQYDIWIILAVCVGILAVARYFFMLLGDYYTFVDEYQTFDAAAGYYKTGKFYCWDFHKQMLSEREYTRAWPHTVLLAFWFRIFGLSVPAGKALSAVFGVLFILSVFYITYKIYYNYYITLLSCLFLLGNESVTVIFRQIRMYSLWLLLIIWFLYFAFLALEEEGNFWRCNKIGSFIQRNLNYSVKYVILALVFFVFSYITHINTLVTGAGILFLYLYLLLTKRSRRYVSLLYLMAGIGAILGILFFLCAKGMGIPVISELYYVLTSDSFFGTYDEQNIRYLYWTRDFLGNTKIMLIGCICVLITFVKNIRVRDRKFDFSLYAAAITGISLYCFVRVFSRYYQDRYMIYVAPLMAIVLAWGIVETVSIGKKRVLQIVAMFFFVIMVFCQIRTDFTDVYFSKDISQHKLVYEKIQEDAETSPVPIAGYNFRDYYGVQVIDDYVTAPFDRAHDTEILYEFAKEYPEGYVVVETAKIYGITESMRIFMQNHSERIAGEGIDEWNIDVCRYHFLYPEDEQKGMYEGTGWESGCVKFSFETRDRETEVRIAVDTSKMAPNAKILFLDFGIFTEAKESFPVCYQLVLPQDGKNGIYEYSAVIDEPCIAVELKDDCEVYYTDETYREMKLWEK